MRLKHMLSTGVVLICAFVSGVFAEQGVEPVSDEIRVLDDSQEQARQNSLHNSGESGAVVDGKLENEPAPSDDQVIELDMSDDEIILQPEEASALSQNADDEADADDSSALEFSVDDARLEFSTLTERNEAVKNLNYAQLALSATWHINPQWETRIAARVDGYQQTGTPDWQDADVDYGENYLRYRGEMSRFTLGTQKVIWGRIDEVPPSDRLSAQDMTRFLLNDLADRRRARPMIRAEFFNEIEKLDLIIMPVFREAELPDVDSIWYPIDRSRGKILGLETTPEFGAVMAVANIIDDAPTEDDGVGLRYSLTGESLDFAMTAQYGRQTSPYFSYDGLTNTFTATYPKSASFGFDLAFNTSGYTWRFEAAAMDTVMVTQADLTGTEAKGANWGAGLEFYPGDGDSRLNLQITGNHLVDTPEGTIERDNIYNLNGSLEMPFSNERWRIKMRFFLGLDKRDVYLNPGIAFLGWEPQEIFLEGHYFDGDEGTLGGYHENHSLVTLGWRAHF